MSATKCCVVGCPETATVTAESEAIADSTFEYCDAHWDVMSEEFRDLERVSDD